MVEKQMALNFLIVMTQKILGMKTKKEKYNQDDLDNLNQILLDSNKEFLEKVLEERNASKMHETIRTLNINRINDAKKEIDKIEEALNVIDVKIYEDSDMSLDDIMSKTNEEMKLYSPLFIRIEFLKRRKKKLEKLIVSLENPNMEMVTPILRYNNSDMFQNSFGGEKRVGINPIIRSYFIKEDFIRDREILKFVRRVRRALDYRFHPIKIEEIKHEK